MDLQRRIAEGESKLKQQQNLYEAVRADRNLYSKNLIEAQDEIQEMKRKFKIMQHQIEQLKEEITGKDLYLLKEHFEHQKVCGWGRGGGGVRRGAAGKDGAVCRAWFAGGQCGAGLRRQGRWVQACAHVRASVGRSIRCA